KRHPQIEIKMKSQMYLFLLKLSQNIIIQDHNQGQEKGNRSWKGQTNYKKRKWCKNKNKKKQLQLLEILFSMLLPCCHQEHKNKKENTGYSSADEESYKTLKQQEVLCGNLDAQYEKIINSYTKRSRIGSHSS
ncbi:hypothetical protein EI555_020927, partial [Monodon monoceros]